MQEVVGRMRRVSEDLREIRTRLENLCNIDPNDQQVLDEVLQLDLIRDFKSSIDQFRLFLWNYFQAAVDRCETEPDHALQELRLRRVTEMLRSLQDEIVMPMTPVQLEAQSLFERLQNIADVAVERHLAIRESEEK